MKRCTGISLLIFSSVLLAGEVIPGYTGKEIFPEPYRCELQVKAGYINDDLDSASSIYAMLGALYRTKPHYFSSMGGGYYLFQFPVRLYAFRERQHPSMLLDMKCRPEIGPPLAAWIPHGFIDIGYLYADHDWFTGRFSSPVTSLMVGGWFRLPLLEPRRGAVMVSGARALGGTPITRFSCSLDWYISRYWGLTIHGDNFTREYQGHKYSHGSVNMGALWRW